MTDIARLGIEVDSSDVNKGTKSLKSLESQSRKTEKAADSVASSFNGFGAAVGAVVGALAIQEVVEFSGTLINAASDAEETQNKFSVVFGSIKDEAEGAASALSEFYGMSEEGSKAALAGVGDLLTGLGLQQDAALDLAKQTVQLGTDLASFTNFSGGAVGATDALTKAMLGETEAAKALGLVLNETQMQAYSERLGLVWKDLTIAEKAQLRLNAAIEQSPNAIGDFARSSKELANQMRILDAIVDDLSVSVGKGLKDSALEGVSGITGARSEIKELGEIVGSLLNSNLSGMLSLFKDSQTGAISLAGSINTLSKDVVVINGQIKILGNSIELVFVDTVLTAVDAISSVLDVTKQLGAALGALASFDFGGTGDELSKIGEISRSFGTDTVERFTGDINDLKDGLDAALDPASKIKEEIDGINEASARAAESVKDSADIMAELAKSTSSAEEPTKEYSKALERVRDAIAKITLTTSEYQQYQLDKTFEREASVLGKNNAELQKYYSIQKNIIQFKKGFADAGLDDSFTARKLEEEQAFNKAIIQLREDEVEAAKKAVEEEVKAQEKALNTLRSNVESVTSNIGDAFADMATTGKFEFESMVDSIIADLARIAAQRAITEPLTSAFSSIGGSIFSGFFHGGGVVGADSPSKTADVSALAFSGATRYHSGGIAGLSPNEVPAVLMRGEEVLTQSDPRHRDNFSGSGGVEVNVYNQADGTTATAAATRTAGGGQRIDVIVKRIVANDVLNNGMVGRAIQNANGLQSPTRGR